MDRRMLLQSSAALAALAAAGRIPAFAENPVARKRNIFTEPPAIEPVTHAVSEFQPVRDGAGTGSAWMREYDLFRWHGIRPDGLAGNPRSGTLRIERRGDARHGLYRVAQRVELPAYEHLDTVREDQACLLESTVETAGETESVRAWSQAAYHMERGTETEQPHSRLQIQGVHDGRSVRIEGDGLRIDRPVEGPLLTPWILPGLLQRKTLSRSRPFEFTLLEEGLKLRRNQRLAYDGPAEIAVAGGRMRCEIWMQTGAGILPVHWVVDERNGVQIMTHSVVNWLLRRVGAPQGGAA